MTHLGQALVFDAHRGVVDGTPLDLVEGVNPTDPFRGLTDCAAVAARAARWPRRPPIPRPAVSRCSGCGSPAPRRSVLTALRYQPDQPALLTREWTSDAVEAGVLGSPVLSADGETVYVNGRDRRLWALHAADGTMKWSVPLDFSTADPAVGGTLTG